MSVINYRLQKTFSEILASN